MLIYSGWATSAFTSLSFFFPIFLYIFFNIYSFFKYLHFLQPLSIPYLFIFPLPSTLISFFISPLPSTLPFQLPTTLYLNIIFHLSLHFFFFFLYPLTINLSFSVPFFTYFSLTKKKKDSLSLSLSQFFGGFFYFSCISTLGW